jgi:hypothetical protein
VKAGAANISEYTRIPAPIMPTATTAARSLIGSIALFPFVVFGQQPKQSDDHQHDPNVSWRYAGDVRNRQADKAQDAQDGECDK